MRTLFQQLVKPNKTIRTLLTGLMLLCSAVSAKADVSIRYYSTDDGLSQNTVRCLLQDHEGFIWVGTTNGINRFDGHRFKTIMPSSYNDSYDDRIQGLSEDLQGHLWITTVKGNVLCYDKVHNALTEGDMPAQKELYPAGSVARKNVPKKVARLAGDARYWAARSGNTYWLATEHTGIISYDTATGETLHYQKSSGLPSNNLRSIMVDRSGDIWAGSLESGLIHLTETANDYRHLQLFPGNVDGNIQEVRLVFCDREGRNWIGSHHGDGLIRIYDGQQQLLRTLALPKGNAYCALELPDGRKAIGTKNGGIYLSDKDGMHILTSLPYTAESPVTAHDVFSMVLDSHQRLWAASFGSGIVVFTPDGKGGYVHLATMSLGSRNRDRVRSIVTDRQGNMWCATDDGLMMFSPDSILASPRSLRHYDVCVEGDGRGIAYEVKTLYIDKQDQLWIGTTGRGLYRGHMDGSGLKIEQVGSTSRHHLSIVQSIASDRNGAVWAVAENYIARILPNYDTVGDRAIVSVPTRRLCTYSENSICLTAKGEMMVGSTEGVYIFDPSHYTHKRQAAAVHLSAISINGEEMTPGTGKSPLKEDIDLQSEIRLPYWQNNVTIACSMLDYDMQSHSSYYYHIESRRNKDEVWYSTGRGNEILLYAMTPGTYRLHIRGYNDAWSEQDRVLTIVILPPWWYSTFACVLYALCVMAVLVYGVRRFVRQQKERSRLEAERSVEKYKQDFFSQISHKLRTPLTVIQGMLDAIPVYHSEQSDDTYKLSVKQMGILNRNANELLRLIDRVLSFNDKSDLEKVRTDIEEVLGDKIAEARLTTPEVAAANDRPDTKGYRILAIDDNADMLDMLRSQLEDSFTVYTARDGKEGLSLLDEVQPDLIICDVMMPGMDGFEFTRRLRDNFNISHIPVILLTASISEERHLTGLEAGADAYITKPFNKEILRAQIIALIAQRQKLQRIYATEPGSDIPFISATERDKQFIERVNEIIMDNIGNFDFKIDDYAQEFNVGRTTFFAKIKSIIGYTPHEYVRIKRMKRAAELLLQTDDNISEICYKVGLNDPYYFSRIFKGIYGKSPSQFRKDGIAG